MASRFSTALIFVLFVPIVCPLKATLAVSAAPGRNLSPAR
jgi:hypothetical protein